MPLCDSANFHQDFLLTEDQVLLVVDVDVVARVFAEQDPVTDLHIEWDAMAFSILPAPMAITSPS